MKIGLLLPANLYFCPYANIYIKILEEKKLDYEIICWDKTGTEEKVDLVYRRKIAGNNSTLKKFWAYYLYARYLKKCIKERHYDKLIVFGPQIGIFCRSFLVKHYRKSFILDYRDLSIEQKCKKEYSELLKNSALNVVSSLGFLKCLPNGFDYVLSHNMNEEMAKEMKNKTFDDTFLNLKKIVILTIGAIRDCEQNIELLDALADNEKFDIQFVGKSDFSEIISNYAKEKNISNVSFIGFYKKEEEREYVEQCTFMNIYYPRKLSHDTALSNRFYNALLYFKPMIVTKNTIQGDFVEKYHLGIAIENCDDLLYRIEEFLQTFDCKRFIKGRNELLNKFLCDQIFFRNSLIETLE